jgi:hypothetical protein
MELLGDADRLLTGGGIADQEDLLGAEQFLKVNEFPDERVVDLTAAGGVVNLDIAPLGLAPGEGSAGCGQDILFRGIGTEDRYLDLLPQGGELLDGGGTDQIEGDQQGGARGLSLEGAEETGVLEETGELGRGGGFAGAVEADYENSGRLTEIDRGGIPTEECRQLILEDFDDLLTRGDALEDLLAQRALLDLVDELLGHGEVDVGVEQGEAYLPQRIGDVRLGEPSMTTEALESLLEFV